MSTRKRPASIQNKQASPKAKKKSGKGNFFAIDRRCWEQVCTLGLNEACAYLALACFSGGDNSTTSASVAAVKRYAGIGGRRAKVAIGSLIDEGFLKKVKDGRHPRYKIIPAAQIPSVIQTFPVEPKREEFEEGESAYSEALKQWKEQLEFHKQQDWIWLPNQIVRGAADELSPVARLRETGEVLVLRFFVDLYYMQNLADDGGISGSFFSKRYERELAADVAQYNIWQFKETKQINIGFSGFFKAHIHRGENGNLDRSALLERIRLLESLGLIQWVPYLVEGPHNQAEPIHPYGWGDSSDPEDVLGQMAHQAALALLQEDQVDRLPPDCRLAPVVAHKGSVQMVGVARLHYRAKTELTAAWWAKTQEGFPRYLKEYESIIEKYSAGD